MRYCYTKNMEILLFVSAVLGAAIVTYFVPYRYFARTKILVLFLVAINILSFIFLMYYLIVNDVCHYPPPAPLWMMNLFITVFFTVFNVWGVLVLLVFAVGLFVTGIIKAFSRSPVKSYFLWSISIFTSIILFWGVTYLNTCSTGGQADLPAVPDVPTIPLSVSALWLYKSGAV
jgi:hypothetical protein